MVLGGAFELLRAQTCSNLPVSASQGLRFHVGTTLSSSAHPLTMALASSRMAGMERMLYRAPFTYGCIFKGRKKTSHLQVFKCYTTQLSEADLRTVWLTGELVSLPPTPRMHVAHETRPFVCDGCNRVHTQIHHSTSFLLCHFAN